MAKRLGGSLLGFGVKSTGEFCMSYECAARRGARERSPYINKFCVKERKRRLLGSLWTCHARSKTTWTSCTIKSMRKSRALDILTEKTPSTRTEVEEDAVRRRFSY
jgi:hypothetical protein